MEPGLRQQRRHPQPASPGAPGGDNLDSLQARAQGLHDVADTVIEQIISGNPERFLSENVQDVGE